ncbi:bifunctional salicylyl-CoA 5-hydroxylase/oxidoreductase [Halomonas sp. MCCC 1A17488]|uniref:bifunctional salicylyl-CoA 5-hydroxylase/oxidoreductase n=1 Tax=unclassified Halomonas TaxID=2609666 RepID=UPI0018D26760|nr:MULTISPECIES: bifunctional salicylyl-CoA 5-hydroxylase/oxidoreductase [unclassified Halomonas]MCE8018163.1 bifunctional salicylyl-CoA 5-hydroxylase/oxidoreductase [Halomonas sp. MCCC 1A17488]MCG3241496.1 bifunctional salicylyl-CoA 5-hydroxylase/oxidoreductase [Halomonas sp. MCCC 1A17488]QPP48547.1 bifunctional salicylyl-CoA 5-hydroxylase/oxidoreductase [Halomonas sp. SS10-MC5]
MRIACLGGGPAGLYFAISMKRRDPSHEIVVIERNRPDDTFGWGVVLSDETLDNLAANDAESAARIREHFAYWDDIAVIHDGVRTVSTGHGFCGIGRHRLLLLLQQRARELGVELRFETDVPEERIDELRREFDLVLAADGLNSRTRQRYAEHFEPDIEVRACKFVWLGTHQTFDDAFTFIFEKTEHGWVWAHAYQFDADTATFIVECSEPTWRAFGFGEMSKEESIATCERIFARHLGGHALMSNAHHIRGSAWINFPRVLCARWSFDNVVLMGDAAATAHFSIGSGTKLALESAIALADYLHSEPDMASAFARYEEERRLEVLRLQSAARNSTEWFEQVERYLDLDPVQFNYSLLTRSQRISHENLRLRDPAWLESAERWFQAQAGNEGSARAPMFAPYRLRDMQLVNRVVVSPMAQYKAVDGSPTDWHFVHYAERAKGGAGLVYTEMTCVSPEGRITPGCPGLYAPEHEAAWKRLCDFVHAETPARLCAQIGHSGPKGSTQLGWQEMDAPLAEGNWPILAASAVPWSPRNQVPRAMTRADMDRVRDEFIAAAQMAERAGFDMLEVHAAHGYLLSSFITPLTNRRDDEYGGSLTNRMRYPLEVIRAVRQVWPAHKPLSVRISANDWVGDEGVTPDEAVEIARLLQTAEVDIVDVSAGQTSTRARPVYGRMFQTPFSDRIRNETGMATMAVGNIYQADHVNSILMAGRADLVCLARPHLADPYWTLHAAAGIQDRECDWPAPYRAGRDQLQRLAERGEGWV